MTDNDALARGTFSSSIADVLELARRDIARTQTDFLGRMNACLMDYEGICDEHPDGDFGHDRQEADDAISGLAGLALAQLMMLRGEDEPLDPPAQNEVEVVARAISEASGCPRESNQIAAGAWWWDTRHDHPANEFAHESRADDIRQATAAIAALDQHRATPSAPQSSDAVEQPAPRSPSPEKTPGVEAAGGEGLRP